MGTENLVVRDCYQHLLYFQPLHCFLQGYSDIEQVERGFQLHTIYNAYMPGMPDMAVQMHADLL